MKPIEKFVRLALVPAALLVSAGAPAQQPERPAAPVPERPVMPRPERVLIAMPAFRFLHVPHHRSPRAYLSIRTIPDPTPIPAHRDQGRTGELPDVPGGAADAS